MTIDQLSDDDIIAEVRKLQYLYGLKREIRYAEKRHEEDTTESVAEHIFGMHMLALYFLTYEDSEGKWDRAKIFTMITLHDIDEIETGDVIAYLKSDTQQAAEVKAMHAVREKSPISLQPHMATIIDEYESRETSEALFVRAIDKFEPLVHLYNEAGRTILHRNHTTIENSRTTKDTHVQHFKSVRRFTNVLHARMVTEGYFYTPRTTP
jgi:5'-deoxynucleotidase YfbR-like HD superfamily hydrolase